MGNTGRHSEDFMENFSPYTALAGGVLLGVAAALLLWLNGRIAGISNVTAGLLAWKPGDVAWRLLFLGGLVAGAGAYYLFQGHAPLPRAEFPGWLLALGGLLVGYGTSFGSGCTSGHGICGLGRLSVRSLVATGAFLVTGIATASVIRQAFGIY
jgi:uncharacterized membrane protein YedE/YeeE